MSLSFAPRKVGLTPLQDLRQKSTVPVSSKKPIINVSDKFIQIKEQNEHKMPVFNRIFSECTDLNEFTKGIIFNLEAFLEFIESPFIEESNDLMIRKFQYIFLYEFNTFYNGNDTITRINGAVRTRDIPEETLTGQDAFDRLKKILKEKLQSSNAELAMDQGLSNEDCLRKTLVQLKHAGMINDHAKILFEKCRRMSYPFGLAMQSIVHEKISKSLNKETQLNEFVILCERILNTSKNSSERLYKYTIDILHEEKSQETRYILKFTEIQFSRTQGHVNKILKEYSDFRKKLYNEVYSESGQDYKQMVFLMTALFFVISFLFAMYELNTIYSHQGDTPPVVEENEVVEGNEVANKINEELETKQSLMVDGAIFTTQSIIYQRLYHYSYKTMTDHPTNTQSRKYNRILRPKRLKYYALFWASLSAGLNYAAKKYLGFYPIFNYMKPVEYLISCFNSAVGQQ